MKKGTLGKFLVIFICIIAVIVCLLLFSRKEEKIKFIELSVQQKVGTFKGFCLNFITGYAHSICLIAFLIYCSSSLTPGCYRATLAIIPSKNKIPPDSIIMIIQS